MQASWQDPPEYRDPPSGGPQFALPGLSPMVKRLMIANAAVFAVTLVLFLVSKETWSGPLGVANLFGLQPELWRSWAPLLPVWQLGTWGFLHSVTVPTHILFNMLGLFFFGTMLEGTLGGRRFLGFYVLALLFAGAVTLTVGLLTGGARPTVGASGAVLAVIVAAAALNPRAQVIFILFPMTLKTLALIVVGLDLFNLLMQVSGNGGGDVAYVAHLAGAAWGFASVKRGWIWKDPLEEVERVRDERAERREGEDQEELDRLLEKIHKEGIGALSAGEKATLKRASKKS